MKRYKKFNIFHFSFSGKSLIEASAGTGKTSTIVFLYLRLILGIECTSFRSLNLTVQDILIVTFTNNTKEELKERIRKNIFELRLACYNQDSQNKTLKLFIKKIKDFKLAIKKLTIALHSFNQASIYTVHGYFNYIVNLYKFYYGITSNTEFVTDVYQLYLDATILFWQSYCYKLPKNISKIIFSYWKEPHALLNYIMPYIKHSLKKTKKFKYFSMSLTKYYKKLIKHINFFKSYWKKKKILYLKNIKQFY